MKTFMGCIADDFTGASDLAGLLARSGVPVNLRIGVPDDESENTGVIEVIALKIRTVPVDVAIEQALAALAWLQRAGTQHFFWKYCSTFDSTPQGNIGPVAEALMEALGVLQTVYCPAFPENGRSIFMGNLFVGELPLAESPMKDHPLTPMRDSNLMRLLQPQVSGKVGLANRLTVAKGADALSRRLEALAREGIAHVVVDAVADEDLVTIARSCRDMKLMTGGSAVAMPLPKIWQEEGSVPAGSAKPQIVSTGKRSIVLSGSCSAMTRTQVAAFKGLGPSLRLDPLQLAAEGASSAVAWLKSQPTDVTPLIYATADPSDVREAQSALGTEHAGALVEDAMAILASEALTLGFTRFVVAGGETSGAVTQALGVRQVLVGPEIAPGVPWCFASKNGQDFAIALKSGNFGAETFFADALKILEAS